MDERVWRLPDTVRGRDLPPGEGSAGRPLSPSAKARLGRIVRRAPEVTVKVTGRARGWAAALKAHLDYLTRHGRLIAETEDGRRISDHAGLRALCDDWLLANAADQRARPRPDAAQSVALILSMPPGTPPDRVEEAARAWARDTLGGRHDYLLIRHDDTRHPHVHVTVRAVGRDGRRLAPGPAELQDWRERFARELRRLGLEAEATPRQARGVVRKAPKAPVLGLERRGAEPRARRADRPAALAEAIDPAPPREWSRLIQARQDAIRCAYLGHAATLDQGDAADRRLAADIRRFVAEMPVPLTRRQALAVELRRVLEERHARERTAAPPAPTPSLHRYEPTSPGLPRRAAGAKAKATGEGRPRLLTRT